MKPGIIRGNLLAVWAGFFLASKWNIDWKIFLGITEGTTLIIGSACVFNNYTDREIDKKMSRTKQRALVQNMVSGRNALIFGTVLGLSGFYVLLLMVNIPAAILGLIGWIDYVIFYAIAKRRSPLSTLVGSISGAVPPAAGYVAVTGRFDLASALLFLILVCWQMPHFYAIAMRRYKDYKAAGLPVLPVEYDMKTTKQHILVYIVAFYAAIYGLYAFGYVGVGYLIVMTIVSIWWLATGIKGFKGLSNAKWAGQMFHYSLVVLTVFCLAISLDLKR